MAAASANFAVSVWSEGGMSAEVRGVWGSLCGKQRSGCLCGKYGRGVWEQREEAWNC
ncbi:MAG: hypothetical protein RLZZ458_1909 [Planctomycetota bacterium]